MGRRRFQIHLSTALLIMFTAGGLLWANMRERKSIKDNWDPDGFEETSENIPGNPVYKTFGWPFDAARQLVGVAEFPGSEVQLYSISPSPKFNFFASSFNVLIALLILTGVYILSESWIRRRDTLSRS